jgi:ribosome-associated toxin RatA of RatAB toxin-antitoxin module
MSSLLRLLPQFRWHGLSMLVLPVMVGSVLPASFHRLPTAAQTHEVHARQIAHQIALTSQEQSLLRQGRVLFSGQEGSYTARVMAHGSTDIAWAVLTDYNNFASFLPSVESSQLLESNGTQKKFEQVNRVRIFPITHRERVVIAVSETYPSNLRFSLVDGDLENLQGAWYVTGAGNQVMITHQVNIRPGGSNRRIFFRIYEDNLKKTMAAIKQEVERRSGG